MAERTIQAEERRHPSLYFADGDIVISASAKDRTFIEFYRVDKVFLARHSSVFKDMLSIGEGSTHTEQYDGVPKVHLPDDAEDVAGFIGALYNPATLPLSKNCRDTPRKVEGIMRLAVKYEIEAIRSVILRHLESEWPQTLEEWERRRNEQKELVLLSDESSFLPDPALAIHFGMEFDCCTILAAAFYELATTPHMSTGPGASIAWDCLAASDLLKVIQGQRRLVEASAEIIRSLDEEGRNFRNWDEEGRNFRSWDDGSDESEPTIYSHTDSDCGRHVANCIIHSLVGEPVLTDPLDFLRRLRDAQEKESAPQYEVHTAISDQIFQHAQEIWEKLPDYFVLPIRK